MDKGVIMHGAAKSRTRLEAAVSTAHTLERKVFLMIPIFGSKTLTVSKRSLRRKLVQREEGGIQRGTGLLEPYHQRVCCGWDC